MTTTLLSTKQRQTDPTTTAVDLAALVSGSTAFALDLYQTLSTAAENLFYSPYSISVALAMTYAGAREETEGQMADALHFALPQERLHPAFNALDLALARRGQGARGKDGGGFRLNIVNALWGQEGYYFLANFLDTLAQNYGAGLRLLDFAGAPDAARREINHWVSDETEGRIEDLIPPGLIDGLTRLVLTNAIYFNAAWARPFPEHRTEDGPFYLLDGSQVPVSMMRQTESFAYAAGPGWQAVELPYDGRELAMLLLLPDAGQFATFEAAL
ncbi:MAG: serpin family protein, partial [Anaerolineae bacterium]